MDRRDYKGTARAGQQGARSAGYRGSRRTGGNDSRTVCLNGNWVLFTQGTCLRPFRVVLVSLRFSLPNEEATDAKDPRAKPSWPRAKSLFESMDRNWPTRRAGGPANPKRSHDVNELKDPLIGQ